MNERCVYLVKAYKLINGGKFNKNGKNHIKRVRPGYGLDPKNFDQIIGKKLISNAGFGEPVSWDFFS